MDHLIFKDEGVLIPKELFGQSDLITSELEKAGVLTTPQNGVTPRGNDEATNGVSMTAWIDLTPELRWLKQHQHEYVGEWVALKGEQLLSHGTNVREVAAAARAAGVVTPFITQIDPPNTLPFGGW
jgi:hypothetical protein